MTGQSVAINNLDVTVINEIVGKTPIKILFLEGNRELLLGPQYASMVLFVFSDKTFILFYHDQDCCESVSVEEAVGDVNDLIGSPLLVAEEASHGLTDEECAKVGEESATWTFYRFATNKGDLTIRWMGSSNGYYGEGVDWRTGKLSLDGKVPNEHIGISNISGLIDKSN